MFRAMVCGICFVLKISPNFRLSEPREEFFRPFLSVHANLSLRNRLGSIVASDANHFKSLEI